MIIYVVGGKYVLSQELSKSDAIFASTINWGQIDGGTHI